MSVSIQQPAHPASLSAGLDTLSNGSSLDFGALSEQQQATVLLNVLSRLSQNAAAFHKTADTVSEISKNALKPAKPVAPQSPAGLIKSSLEPADERSTSPATIQPFDYSSLTDVAKQDFLHNVLNGMKTHQSHYDPMPTTIPSEETIREGLLEHFAANPDGVTRDADGSFTTEATFRWIRHAQGLHNEGKWFTADAPLTSRGKGQVKELGINYKHALDSSLMSKADLDFCSPSLRCEDTLAPVNEINGCPRIFTHAYREQPTSYFANVPGPSSMDPNRELQGSVWNASGVQGKLDPWAKELNEEHTHMDNRMWEGLGLACTTASMLSELTGQSKTVFDISAHADCGRSFATNLCSLAGITDKKKIAELTGYYNTAMKEFDVRIRTDANGTRSLVPFEDGSLVKFGPELLPGWAKEAKAQQAAYEKQMAAMTAASMASRSARSSGLSGSGSPTNSTQSNSTRSGRSSLASAELEEVMARAFAAERRRSQMAPISVNTPSTVSTLSTAA